MNTSENKLSKIVEEFQWLRGQRSGLRHLVVREIVYEMNWFGYAEESERVCLFACLGFMAYQLLQVI